MSRVTPVQRPMIERRRAVVLERTELPFQITFKIILVSVVQEPLNRYPLTGRLRIIVRTLETRRFVRFNLLFDFGALRLPCDYHFVCQVVCVDISYIVHGLAADLH